MILDEITAFLDLPRRVEIMKLLGGLAGDPDRSILISTHDLDLALRTADRIWLLRADGTLCTGAPEDLVLDGSFAEAFAAEGIEFDPMRGAFNVRKDIGARIKVIGGDAIQRKWTLQALERCGFQAIDEDKDVPAPAPCPSIEPLGSKGWRLRHGSVTNTFDKLYDLVRELKGTSLSK